MASNNEKFCLVLFGCKCNCVFLAANASLISSAIVLQLLSVLLIKISEEQRRVNNLTTEAIMARNTALRYRHARYRHDIGMQD